MRWKNRWKRIIFKQIPQIIYMKATATFISNVEKNENNNIPPFHTIFIFAIEAISAIVTKCQSLPNTITVNAF